MKTRRKSKAAAAAAAEEEEDAASSQVPEESLAAPPDATSPLELNIPGDLDIGSLSKIFPDVSLTTPTQESVLSLYRLVLAQASEVDATQRELDDARANAERKDIELDQALQDRESLTKELEGSLGSIQRDLQVVKEERDQLTAERTSLQAQIASLSTLQSSSSTEADTLKHRIDDTEREKRELVSVISRLKEDSTQREDEIQTLRTNLKQARHDYQDLESQVRELRSTEASTKFKIDSLSQQLQLSQSEAERVSSELSAKSEEFGKYRRAKHAELVQVQASYDSLTQTFATTESSLKALQSAHLAQAHQLTQALTRVQDLTGQLAEQEATYTSEVSGLRRLVGMMEEREKQAKEIVEGIEREWAGVGERAERREFVLREEVENEKRGKEEALKRIEHLELVLEKIDRGVLPTPGRVNGDGFPATPARTPGTPDFMTQGMMGLSPTVALASKVQKSGKTFTEVYADYVRLQEEFQKKTAEYDHMDRTLAAVLAQIEERAPILSQQRAEYERLQSEASQLASQLAQALSERDAQSGLAVENSQKLTKSTRENELLQKQLSDLGRQIQSLLKEIGRRDDPTIPSDEEFEQMGAFEPAENIDSVITNNLVLFRSIGGLQEQNQKLLKIVRELGEKMEVEEKEYKEVMEREQGEAVREAHEAIQDLAVQLERQKKSSEQTIQAYMKERDALKSMLTRAERSARVDGLSERANGPGDMPNMEPTDLAEELVEIQGRFEAYKSEMGADSIKLREELIAAQREAGQLGATIAKANAKIEYLTDHHRMTQEQFAMQNKELNALTKRNQQLYDQYTRIDIEFNRVTEDLLVANSRVEQLRNECANLRAEKKIWEGVQIRLVEENKTLTIERSHLSDLMGNVQKMHNDLERSGENDRRRLESQMHLLEGQTQDLRVQLMQERDSVRHITLQKDIESKELQARLDKSSQELSKTRESLVGAETSKRHYEERVEDLTRQIRGFEEKLSVYERRSSTVNGVVHHSDSDLSREQQLETEVAELRAALKVTEVDLATARSHVQQFQEISQANEAALATLGNTFDEYKSTTESQIAKHESDYQAVQEKIEAVQTERAHLVERLAEVQKILENERIAWANDKKTLEDTIVDMSTSEKHSESDRNLRESATRQQEERAIAAEERYSREVIAHADSMKTLEDLKQRLANAEVSARNHLSASETAQAKLASSEASWKQQKESLDKEISDLYTRCSDISSQNAILHQHLESVTSQAARIRQAADSDASATTDEQVEDADTKLSELRSVVAYLRKEKEIVDLQLELSKQENTRFKAHIEHLSQSLDETRVTLSEERERAVEAAASNQQHAELLERINQLNILRESNATLRSDCEAQSKRSRELDAKLQQLSAELDPAKEKARVAEAELEARSTQLKRLEEENRRWQERNSQLLTKYDRIDPAEVQKLKDEIEQLKLQKAERDEQLASQTQRIEALEDNVRSHREMASKNTTAFRQRLGQVNKEKSQLNDTITALRDQLKNLTAERENLQTESNANVSKELNQQIENLRREKEVIEKALTDEKASKAQAVSERSSEHLATITALKEERDKLLAEKEAWKKPSSEPTVPDVAVSEDMKSQWEAEKTELIRARDEALAQGQTAGEQAKKAAEEVKNIRFSNEKFQAKLKDLQKARVADSERASAQQEAAVSAALEKVKREGQASTSSTSDDSSKRLTEALQAQEQRLNAKHQEELKAALEATRADVQKNATASDSDQKAEINIAEIQARHADEVVAAVERGRMEQAAKSKVKDAQLVRAQTKLKELEAQILVWRKSGILPDATPATSAVASAAPTVSSPNPNSSNPPATPTPNANLPRKPSINGPPAAGPLTVTGRGRGAPVRGAQRGLAIRGAAPGRGAPAGRGSGTTTAVSAGPSAPNATGGVSIIGAAGKRTREEGDAAPDDSLAKRLKPAEPATAATGKPVTLRRPPPT